MAAEGFSFTGEIEAQERAEAHFAEELVGKAPHVDEERGASAGEAAEAPSGGEDVVIEVRHRARRQGRPAARR